MPDSISRQSPGFAFLRITQNIAPLSFAMHIVLAPNWDKRVISEEFKHSSVDESFAFDGNVAHDCGVLPSPGPYDGNMLPHKMREHVTVACFDCLYATHNGISIRYTSV